MQIKDYGQSTAAGMDQRRELRTIMVKGSHTKVYILGYTHKINVNDSDIKCMLTAFNLQQHIN